MKNLDKGHRRKTSDHFPGGFRMVKEYHVAIFGESEKFVHYLRDGV